MNVMRTDRGMTLVEIMVAVVLGMIVLTAVYTAFLSQNAMYLAQSKVTEAQQNGRIALEYLAQEVRMAGFGITPTIAFNDFLNPPVGCSAGSACACRNNVAADGGADEMYVAYRDPYFQWGPISTVQNVFSYPAITTTTTFTTGTIFWIVDAAYDATLANTLYFQAGCSSCNPVTQLGATGFYNPTLTLPLQGQFNGGNAYQLRYRHFYIDTSSGTPTLMLDVDPTGARSGAKPIATGIEDIQFVYVMANGDELLGPAFANTCPNPAATPATVANYLDTHNLVNLRSIRINVVARSSSPDSSVASGIVWRGGPLTVEDHIQAAVVDYYRRRLFQTTVNVWNVSNAGGYFTATDL